MPTDPFASPTFSLVLSWLFVLFDLLFGVVGVIGAALSEEGKARDRLAVAWIAICALIFGPARYLLLQLLLAETYSVQSVSAFLSTLILTAYMPIVFAIMCWVGLGLPLLATGFVAGWQVPMSRVRAAIAVVLCPAFFYLGSIAFFWFLPYAAYSTHWVGAKDLMRGANGPAEHFYAYIVDVDIPYLPARISGNVGATPKERLRSHLAELYLGKKERWILSLCYFNNSVRCSNEAGRIIDRGSGFIIMTSPEDYARMLDLNRAALRDAQKVDVALLNERYPTFGDHYTNLFVEGLRMRIAGYEASDEGMLVEGNRKLLQGWRLMDRWSDWHEANRGAMKREQ